jgi:pyrroloquinoline-quinone synthase
MTTKQFLEQLDERVAKYDLLCHPFYKAWSAGELTRNDLAEYGSDYYHHVAEFPEYLKSLGSRLTDEKARRAVEANMVDENGGDAASGRSHAEIWLDFVEGMSGSREIIGHQPIPEINALMEHFTRVAREGAPEEALAAFYAYESQVPRIAQEKERGLRANYGANDATCEYFRLHSTADIYHSQVWRRLLERQVSENNASANAALDAAEAAARSLWQALDGMEARRTRSAA